MRPALTVLQLDTRFPRVPGDVACPDTYLGPVEIIRIPAASVSQIVTDDPTKVDIQPFLDAMLAAQGDVIATSCGFLAHWQTYLQSITEKPVVASALTALPRLADAGCPVTVLTFDEVKLNAGHADILRAHSDQVIGLHSDMHLRQVIAQDAATLDQEKALAEIQLLVREHLSAHCRTLLLECTNLPPYKTAIRDAFKGKIVDILTEIEARRPGTVQSAFL